MSKQLTGVSLNRSEVTHAFLAGAREDSDNDQVYRVVLQDGRMVDGTIARGYYDSSSWFRMTVLSETPPADGASVLTIGASTVDRDGDRMTVEVAVFDRPLPAPKAWSAPPPRSTCPTISRSSARPSWKLPIASCGGWAIGWSTETATTSTTMAPCRSQQRGNGTTRRTRVARSSARGQRATS